jgi:Tfp pilus assembly PilM family ATPase
MRMLGYSNTMLGIDIGSHSIKLAAMRRRRRRWLLLCGMSEPVVGNAGETLERMLRTLPASLRSRHITADVAVQGARVLFRKVLLPATLDDQQVDLAINLELQKHMPSQDAQALFADYHPIAGREPDAGRDSVASTTWLTATCPAPVMNDCLQTLEKTRVKPSRVCIDVLALDACDTHARAQSQGEKSLNLYIDAGFSAIRLYALNAGVPGYIRSYPLAPVARQAGDRAEFLLTMRRALQQYHLSDMLAQPERVLLFGGRYASPGLDDLIRQYCGCNPHAIDPLIDWCLESSGTPPLSVGPTLLAPAIALSMQEQM